MVDSDGQLPLFTQINVRLCKWLFRWKLKFIAFDYIAELFQFTQRNAIGRDMTAASILFGNRITQIS